MVLPLAGLRVIEISRVLTGAYCSMVLADLGADVVKVERPEGGDDARRYGPPVHDGDSYYFLSVNRNKRSIALDLHHERDQQKLREIVASSDVLVHNYLPKQVAKLGFEYETLRTINPGLIYCAISGFGNDNPFAGKPALDIVVQAASGAMSITGEDGSAPLRTPIPAGDLAASLFAALSITAAHLERMRTGAGQRVDVSLLHSLVAFLPYHWAETVESGIASPRRGNAHPAIVPYDCYPTVDGHVVLAVNSDQRWLSLCAALGVDPDVAASVATNLERVQRRTEVDALVGDRLRTMPTTVAVTALERHGVPCAAVDTLLDVSTGTLAHALGLFRPADGEEGPPIVSSPLHLSNHPVLPARRAPRLGQHTVEFPALLENWRRRGIHDYPSAG